MNAKKLVLILAALYVLHLAITTRHRGATELSTGRIWGKVTESPTSPTGKADL